MIDLDFVSRENALCFAVNNLLFSKEEPGDGHVPVGV
jgi:hypothetical protein